MEEGNVLRADERRRCVWKPSVRSKTIFLNKLEEQPQSQPRGTLLQSVQAPHRPVTTLWPVLPHYTTSGHNIRLHLTSTGPLYWLCLAWLWAQPGFREGAAAFSLKVSAEAVHTDDHSPAQQRAQHARVEIGLPARHPVCEGNTDYAN